MFTPNFIQLTNWNSCLFGGLGVFMVSLMTSPFSSFNVKIFRFDQCGGAEVVVDIIHYEMCLTFRIS